MNRISFLDELLKLGGVRVVVKVSSDLTSDPPAGLMNPDAAPPAEPHQPTEAASRLPATAHIPAQIHAGQQGDITTSRNPIDQYKFNWGYRESVS